MTWWQKLFGINKVDEKPKNPRAGEVSSPEYVSWLKSEGFYYNADRKWWQRVWTTAVPWRNYPNLKEVWETYNFDPDLNDPQGGKWTYRIINPDHLGGIGGGGGGSGWLIWEKKIGEKE